MTFKDLQYCDPVESRAMMECGESEIPDEIFREADDGLNEPAAAPIRHLSAGTRPTTLCGLDRSAVAVVHPSKARKSDCPACREEWRRLKNGRFKFTQTAGPAPGEPHGGPMGTPPPAPAKAEPPPKGAKEAHDPAIDAEVRRLRATPSPATGKPRHSHMEIEAAMGWKPQHGNRPWRICRRLGIK